MITLSSRGANPEGRFLVAALLGMTNKYCASRNDTEVVIPSEARDLLRPGRREGRFLVAPLLGMTAGGAALLRMTKEVNRLTPEGNRTAPLPLHPELPTTDYRLPTEPSSCRLSTVGCRLPP
jgi:hypothetical protein